jgi:hypothetical protein
MEEGDAWERIAGSGLGRLWGFFRGLFWDFTDFGAVDAWVDETVLTELRMKVLTGTRLRERRKRCESRA